MSGWVRECDRDNERRADHAAIKAEAYREFAERLKAKAVKNADTRDPAMLPYVTDDDIDAVLKEMEKEGRPLRDFRA